MSVWAIRADSSGEDEDWNLTTAAFKIAT